MNRYIVIETREYVVSANSSGDALDAVRSYPQAEAELQEITRHCTELSEVTQEVDDAEEALYSLWTTLVKRDPL